MTGLATPTQLVRRRKQARSAVLVNALPPVVILLVTAPALIVAGDRRWWVWFLDVALVLPLLVRRRHPYPVFWVMAAVAFVQWSVGLRLPADIALLVALFMVAAYAERRRALAAAGVLELGAVLASVRFPGDAGGVLASLVFLTGLVAAALFIGINLQTRRAYLASLVDRAERLERERDQQAQLAATAERTRIAREMHDIVAHSLSVMISLADGATAAGGTHPEEAAEAMRQASATGRLALAEMRRLLDVLRQDTPSDFLPQPDLDRIDDLIEQFRASGLIVRLATIGARRPLVPTAETTIYRVVQEGLTNALRHARNATTVVVTLTWTADSLTVDLCDDGEPMAAPPPAEVGHGLDGMRERVSIFAGSVTAGRDTPAAGWHVCAKLPLADATS